MKTTFPHRVTLSMIASSLAACYGSAPPRPARIQLPPIVAGAELAVHSEERTEIESVDKEARTCPPGRTAASECTVTKYTAREPVTRVHTTMTYADQPVTLGQFKVMTDPQYSAKLARLDALSRTCRRANIPRYLGLGLAVGGLVASAVGAPLPVTLGLVGGGVASYGVGYFVLGGQDCNEAARVYGGVEHGYETMTEVTGQQVAEEIQMAAARFNATHSTTPAMGMR